MEINFIKLFGRHPSVKGPACKKLLWEKLVDTLNLLGPIKSTIAWQRCWTEAKSTVKKKVASVHSEQRATGGGPKTMKLTEEDLRIVNIIKLENVAGLEIPESKVGNIKVS